MKRELHVDFLAVLFGIGTWVCVNGLWVELPLMVRALPEGWNLPSYLTVMIQLANIGPILYTILHSMFKNVITETRTIYLTMTIGSVATILLVFFWESKSKLFGETRSTALLALVFFLALVDCTSRVLFLPFMARFQHIYLTSFFIGEGLSGLVPSIFALIQGVGGNPECRLFNVTEGNSTEEKLEAHYPDPVFTIETFFYILFGTMILSALSFHLLTYKSITKYAVMQQSPGTEEQNPTEVLLNSAEPPASYYQSVSQSNSLERLNQLNQNFPANAKVIREQLQEGVNLSELQVEFKNSKPISTIRVTEPNGTKDQIVQKPKSGISFQHVSKSLFYYLLLVQFITCALSNGTFPAIQSYSSLPYGNVAFHLAVTLSTIANPSVCFLLFILPKPNKYSITGVGLLGFMVAIYVMTTALMSPNPPLVNEKSGEVLLVIGWVLLVAFFTYVKVSVATLLRAEGKRGLFWCGAVTQLGSAIGAVITFFLVTETSIFESYYPCQ